MSFLCKISTFLAIYSCGSSYSRCLEYYFTLPIQAPISGAFIAFSRVRVSARNFAICMKPWDVGEMMVSLARISPIQRSCASIAFLVSTLPLFGAAPVANNDTYVVDVGGSVNVRAKFLSTITAKSPALYWDLNDVSTSGTTPSVSADIDPAGGVDGSSFIFSPDGSMGLLNAPLLRPTGGFKGFDSSNTWWELGDADGSVGDSGGYIQNLVNPKTSWGSDVGSISLWF